MNQNSDRSNISSGVYEKIILVTRKTRLEALLQRFNTFSQAKFYIERSGSDFADYEREHETYHAALKVVRAGVDGLAKLHCIERGFLPNFLFTEKDMVVTVGQDGLVVNTAKYLDGQPIIAVNPDPARFDGVLLPFSPAQAAEASQSVLKNKARFKSITMAEAALSDGQKLLAFNDLFIGRRGHASSFYSISFGGRQEIHSSSGIIVSTGAGSSGWLSSLYNMARGIAGGSEKTSQRAAAIPESSRFAWDAQMLRFVVREPFISKWSQAGIVLGDITPDAPLVLESRTPEEGVIFSDGVESDFLQFNSGARATIRISERRTMLAV